MNHLIRWSAVAVFALSVVADLRAGVPDYGYQWATIGDPGNRPTQPEEVPDRPELQIGSVGYEYRMATTEVTIGQWYEFVLAYAPYYEGPPVNTAFTGQGISGITGGFVIIGDPSAPTRMSWEYAARYCNWLNNGKTLTRDAFENGAYDTSTFTFNQDGSANHQLAHNPGALFWIPTLDEWTKAAHWDPTKNNGAGGYWRYPGASNDPLVSGPPEGGGETNAGPSAGPEPVGSYPSVNAPWGLLDTSGGVSEWTESPGSTFLGFRLTRGSSRGSSVYALRDALDAQTIGGVTGAIAGVRLASIVPSPSALCVGLMMSIPHIFRRRTCLRVGDSRCCSWGLCSVPQLPKAP